MIRRFCSLFLAIVAIASALPIASPAQSVMTHHVREVTRTGEARLIGRKPSAEVMSLDLVLPLRDPAGLKAFLADLYNPKSPTFHKYLTPAEFTAMFGPTQAQYDEVLAFAKNNALTVTGGSRDGMEVQVKGTVAAVESAMHIALRTYQHPTEDRVFFAPDREPTPNLSFNLWHVSGLDNYSLPHALHVSKTEYAQAHGISPEAVKTHASTGSGPSASFLGSDMRAAYATGTTLTGAGQNLGLFEYLGTDLADLTTYYKNVGQTNNVPITLLSTDGTSTSCLDTRAGGNCDDTEQTLDMTQALGMAPGLASLTMYVGSLDTAIISSMTTHSPLPTTIGCSWGWTPADPTTLDPYFQKMSAQGQNFFAASGDSSTWSSKNEAWPADDAYVVSVGGTDLVTSSAAGPWSSETAWVDSGGGITPDSIAIPSYQQLSGVINSSNKGSTTLRNGPDVSANANFSFYTCADQTTCLANEYGGTSFAAPMWAAYIALVDQQLVANGKPTIGFINPTIYSQNVTSAYATNFHDITSGTSGSYSATTGYDLVTGWGSPKPALITALTGTTTPTNDFSIAATSTTIAAGASGTSSITTAVTAGAAETITLSASSPTGITVAFNPGSVTSGGGSTATITVASTVAAGTYSVLITGTAASGSHTATITLTVTSTTGSGSFTVAVSPTAGSLPRGDSGYATVTTTVSGGFSAPISFTATGMESGVTVSFSPNPIAAPGSGTTEMLVTAASSAARATFPIKITATGGGKTVTATLTLTITR
ncbi:S53 family serine peptidase [Granulicella aggregans]|uniref:S53 family serine peptidase n=1 Tax=Granulicella aggregans TaxID=474949 RepID=UPI0021E08B30|nr:S53 family serine peptidase [Granulicella aggregans]